ncbi:N-acetylmannosamine kinase [Piscirickettsia salmonis]|uniref:ROK family protein n=1 Tax=Piscirickettsia salmonis TaxID=1238 RepID=A0A1L6TGF7_PISSA|nr:ROK family protein [Piscirickettsia salmonis]AKP72888.1 ROK family protein [Piscirickettsia salmonis LF-89 = ATCC VR-1361]ALB21506.1 ROK family protein [Piscirickettsia salmonis]ALY01725.1 ROK family protein [Piscirickettsia salmonis]AMA41241.1 ROK family protein [Piscirickettsia salmonis]AOS36430.1 ROK family protein [Piscirickettsia salmonis]
MILVLDLGGTKLAAALFDGDKLFERQQRATCAAADCEPLKQQLSELIAEYHGRFDAISIACTGVIKHGRMTAVNAHNLGGLLDFALEDFLKQQVSCPIFMLNDAQAATYGEATIRGQVAQLAFITLSTGIGGGVIVNGQLLQGASGHLGHTVVDPAGPLCGCGRCGCAEAIASGTALATLGSEALGKTVCARELIELSAVEPKAAQVMMRAVSVLVGLIADIQAIFEINHIVIGGSVGLNPVFFAHVKQGLNGLPNFFRPQVVEQARLVEDAGLYGAAQWALQAQGQHADHHN